MNDTSSSISARRLIDAVASQAGTARVSDVRLGLGYSAVRLDDGAVGISWSPKEVGHACTVFAEAGTLRGRPVTELIAGLAHAESPWRRCLGLAAANAVINRQGPPAPEPADVVARLALTAGDRVAMVGRFQPLLAGIRASGCKLEVIELEPSESDSLPPDAGRQALRLCTVAIVTATSLVTGTLDGLLADLRMAAPAPRAVVLLGPSVPMLPEAFVGTPITMLAGSWVRDRERVLEVVSEGGGTPQLRSALQQAIVATR